MTMVSSAPSTQGNAVEPPKVRAFDYLTVWKIFAGSDGEATRALYERLGTLGPAGLIAINLFRAVKTSGNAKKYRGRTVGLAYQTKDWALGNLVELLEQNGEALGIRWGWGRDEAQPFHKDVLYVDLPCDFVPNRAQVSFHASGRKGDGPDYAGEWDGTHKSAERVCAWVIRLLKGK